MSGLRQWHVCGATRTGGSHARDGCPNQDSWRPLRGRAGRGAVVCDGLGSKPHARLGSRAACAAVAEALRLRRKFPAATDDQLIRSIHLLWAMTVAPLDPADCATTCLFAAVEPQGGLVVGQLGDGAILVETADGAISRVAADLDFAGPTTGLGVATDLGEWTLRRFEPGDAGLVMLATDGVADDLLPDGLDLFARYLRHEVLRYPAVERDGRLALMLKSWPTPGYSDDKTIALLWPSDQG